MKQCVWLTVLMDVEDLTKLEWPASRRSLLTLPGVVRVYGTEVSQADATGEADFKTMELLEDRTEEW